MDDFKHGRRGYSYNKCRCDICKTATSEYRKQLREEKRSKALPRLSADPLVRRIEREGRISEVHPNIVGRWKRNGMSIYWADHWAIHFGWHPVEIWGMAFYAGIDYTDAA